MTWKGFAVGLVLLAQLPQRALGEENAALVGAVRDAATDAPLPYTRVDVKSTVTGVSRTFVTDAKGEYCALGLPPGNYSVSLSKTGFRSSSRDVRDLRANSMNRVDAHLMPLELQGEEVVVSRQPAVDIGSSTIGVTITPEFLSRIPIWNPSAQGAATRSFEALADIAPGVNADLYGYSMSGTSSPENQYLVDGVPIREPGQGFIGTPLSAEFVREVNVITGGLASEYGRVTGGVNSIVTKSGTNEIRGSFFSSIMPGAFEGARTPVERAGQTIQTDTALSSIRDIGFDVGGPIRKNLLWYYGGAAISMTRYNMDRYLNKQVWGKDSGPIWDATTGAIKVETIPGTHRFYVGDQRVIQYIGKLTWQPFENVRGELVAFGSHTRAGGNGAFAVRPQTGAVEYSNIAGTFESLASDVTWSTINVVGSISASFLDKHLFVDANLAWARYGIDTLPSDGSTIGGGGLANIPHVWDRKSIGTPHSIVEYGEVPATVCPNGTLKNADGSTTSVPTCPVSEYHQGGPRGIDLSALQRGYGKINLTWLTKALGQHIVKAGIDVDITSFDHTLAYPGGVLYRENRGGTAYTANQYGVLVGPAQTEIQPYLQISSLSIAFGGFMQDSWSIAQGLTVNAGVRYDSQVLIGNDGRTAIGLHNQWAPRVGIVYDFTRVGRSKIFGHFGKYYESLPLYLADRSFPGDRILLKNYSTAECAPLASDPTKACSKPINLPPSDPNRYWQALGNEPAQVDPALRPQSLDELLVGAEYEFLPGGRVALQYTKRWLNDVIDDISRDEATTYFIGNPGSGIAKDFPSAQRAYDALTLLATKTLSRGWLAQASYTLSWQRGNYYGLFQPETNAFQPNRNSDFDRLQLTVNRTGPLPGDRRHQIKIFAAKDFEVLPWAHITAGVAIRAQSGTPTSYLSPDSLYKTIESFILPRGSGDRLPWVASIDPGLSASFSLRGDRKLKFSVDTFNVFNFQAVTAVDNTYTTAEVLPIVNGTRGDVPGKLVYADGSGRRFDVDKDKNPNFGKPTAYQAPRQVRIAVGLAF